MNTNNANQQAANKWQQVANHVKSNPVATGNTFMVLYKNNTCTFIGDFSRLIRSIYQDQPHEGKPSHIVVNGHMVFYWNNEGIEAAKLFMQGTINAHQLAAVLTTEISLYDVMTGCTIDMSRVASDVIYQ